MTKKAEKKKLEQKMVHIHAASELFEIHEVTTNEKSIRRVQEIKDYFIMRTQHPHASPEVQDAKLAVRTRIINPTLF